MASRSLEPGTLIGLYEVDSSLGEGGMGAVCRARETRLERDVEINYCFLTPPAIGKVARFQRDSEVLASLTTDRWETDKRTQFANERATESRLAQRHDHDPLTPWRQR